MKKLRHTLWMNEQRGLLKLFSIKLLMPRLILQLSVAAWRKIVLILTGRGWKKMFSMHHLSLIAVNGGRVLASSNTRKCSRSHQPSLHYLLTMASRSAPSAPAPILMIPSANVSSRQGLRWQSSLQPINAYFNVRFQLKKRQKRLLRRSLQNWKNLVMF